MIKIPMKQDMMSARIQNFLWSMANVDETNLTGKIAIGDVTGDELRDTDAKMIVRSDEGEDAGIILEPKQPEANGTFIRLRDQNHSIEVDNQGAMTVRSGNTLALSALDKLSLSSDDIIEIGGTSQKVTLTGHVGINTTNDLTNYQYALIVDGGILTSITTTIALIAALSK